MKICENRARNIVKISLVLLTFASAIAAAFTDYEPSNVDDAFAIVASGYPAYRDYWGTFSVVSGVYNGIWGAKEFFSAENTLGSIIGFGLTFSAWTTFFDGLRLLWGLSGIEAVNERYKRYAPGTAKDFGGVVSRSEFGSTRLKELSDDAYSGRIMRMSAHLIAGGGLLYFFGVGPDKGSRYLLVSGIITTAAGFFRLLQDSPEEMGQRLLGHTVVSFRLLPLISSVWLEVRF